jgi:hypothetical protein
MKGLGFEDGCNFISVSPVTLRPDFFFGAEVMRGAVAVRVVANCYTRHTMDMVLWEGRLIIDPVTESRQ